MPGVLLLIDNPLIAQMNAGELPVAIFELKLDASDDRSCSAADLRKAVLEAVGQIYTDSMLCAGDRVADRLARHVEHTRYLDSCAARVNIDRERDWFEQRLQLGWSHGRIHPPHRGHFLGTLAGEYL